MTKPRTPPGVPAGGEFSTQQHDESDVSIDRPRRVDPQAAWHMDWRTLDRLTPTAAPDDGREIRQQFAQHLQRFPAATWEEGWNAYIGPRHEIQVPPRKCRRCNGFRVDIRRGGVPCRECNARGRTQAKTLRANPAPSPT